jgi:hypothetical protein
VFIVLALVAILASIPWPGTPHARPLLRWYPLQLEDPVIVAAAVARPESVPRRVALVFVDPACDPSQV